MTATGGHRGRLVPAVAIATMIACSAGLASAADFATYRDFTIGMSPSDVVLRAKAAERDLRTLHERPSLLQTLSWRPPFVVNRTTTDQESVRSIVFSFVDRQLFRIAVEYDRSRTEGLTAVDMVASFTGVYGERLPAPVPARRPGYDVLDAPVVLAQWRQGETTVVLQQMAYSGSFSLVVTSVPLELLARRAQALAVTTEAREAPARQAAKVKDDAAAAKAAADKLRTTNKAEFKP